MRAKLGASGSFLLSAPAHIHIRTVIIGKIICIVLSNGSTRNLAFFSFAPPPPRKLIFTDQQFRNGISRFEMSFWKSPSSRRKHRENRARSSYYGIRPNSRGMASELSVMALESPSYVARVSTCHALRGVITRLRVPDAATRKVIYTGHRAGAKFRPCTSGGRLI